MINTLANTFRSTYGEQLDISDTEIALYHDALHAALGVGISLDNEVYLQGIEGQLRQGIIPDVMSDCLPDELCEEFIEFYSK